MLHETPGEDFNQPPTGMVSRYSYRQSEDVRLGAPAVEDGIGPSDPEKNRA